MFKGGGRPIDKTSTAQKKPWGSMGISRKTYYKRKKLGVL